MGVVIESSVWEPNPALYIFIFILCLASILLFPYASKLSSTTKNAAILLDHGVSSSFLRFQRNFLFLYSLASAMEGLWSVFGELEFAHHGVSREQMVLSLCLGSAAALLAGPFLGVLSDLIGPEKFCMIFCILHLFVGVWKRIVAHPSVLVASICLSLASSVFSFSFETWMVVQHEKEGHRQDSMGDTFWLMTFFESASYIGSQMLANWLVGDNMEKNLVFPSTAAIFLAARTIICVTGGLRRTSQTPLLKEYRVAFHACIFGVGRIGCIMEYNNKRIWLLAWAQACLHFSVTMFWVLWAPTLVADGREVHMGLIYPCLLGARMLGSTLFAWLISGPSSLRTEDCLVYLFLLMGCVLSVIAYDYQEIGVLVALFCLFHACVGLILPSLARLRTMYVPNELRGGMMGLSLAPANAAILLFVIQGGYYRNIGNAAIMAVAALGLLTAAGSMHVLKQLGKQPYQKVGTNWDSYP